MKATAAVGLGLILTSISHAQVLYSTGFEASEGYTAGVQLTSQNGWVAGSPYDVSTSPVFAGSQAARFSIGGNTTGVFHALHTFTAVNSGSAIANVKIFMPAGDALNTCFGLNFSSGGVVLGGVGVSTGGTIYGGGTGNGFDFGTVLGHVQNPLGAWIDLGVTATVGSTLLSLTVDGQNLVQVLQAPVSSIDGVNLDAVRLAIEVPNSTCSFDNVSVTAVPEPGTWIAIGAGIGALSLRRRRSRAI